MSIKPNKIMVVDDEPVIRDMMVDLLDMEGYPVETARNGSEALERLRSAPADDHYLVFLDLMMPVMDGREFCYILNANAEMRHKHIIIIMSALNQLSQIADLHADGTMSKPFVMEDVVKLIEHYMAG